MTTPDRSKRRRLIFWVLVFLLVVVPIPIGQTGIYGSLGNPALFWLFDWINQFLPENY